MNKNIEFIGELRRSAEAYFKLGFNITGIKNFEKAPYHKWKEYSSRRQEEREALFHEWHSLTGIGAITGINQFFCLDFDQCAESNVPKYLVMLGLPPDYNWVVISGSQKGFHIWFKSSQLHTEMENIEKAVLGYAPKVAGDFKQIELRINQHVVLPPSKSASGGEYRFLTPNDLTKPPAELEYDSNLNQIQN